MSAIATPHQPTKRKNIVPWMQARLRRLQHEIKQAGPERHMSLTALAALNRKKSRAKQLNKAIHDATKRH